MPCKVKTITRAQYHELLGIASVAKSMENAMNELKRCALTILPETDNHGTPDEHGHVSDLIYCGNAVDHTLKVLGVKVEE